MDRLKLLDAGLRAFDATLPGVVPPLCLATRYRASSCRRCLDVCPTAAIEPAPWLRVTPERCSSCGACAAVCPTGALAFAAPVRGAARTVPRDRGRRRAPGRAGLPPGRDRRAGHRGFGGAARRAGRRRGRRAVPGRPVGGRADRRGCRDARRPDAGERRLRDVSRARRGPCGRCRGRRGGCDLRPWAAVSPWSGAPRRAPPPARRPRRRGARGPALSRRDLFAFLARGARRTAAEGLASQRRTIADLHGQAPPPAGHARLLTDLATLAARGDVDVATPPPPPPRRPPAPPARSLPAGLPTAVLEVGPGCTGCDLCVHYCPHAALALAGGAPRCDESLCTGCGLCVEVCPPAALALRAAVAGPWPATHAGIP